MTELANNGASHVPGGAWTDTEKERGLVAVALCSESYARASRELAEQGLRIPAKTLQAWTKREPELYQRIRAKQLPELREKVSAEHEALARRQIEVATKLTERLDREADELPIRDVSTAQRNLDVGSGIHTQRAAELRGDVQVQVSLTYEEIIRSLKKFDLIDSEAVEVEAVELEEGTHDGDGDHRREHAGGVRQDP